MNITDPRFRYVPSHKTDVAKTFERERKRIAEQQAKLVGSKPTLTVTKKVAK